MPQVTCGGISHRGSLPAKGNDDGCTDAKNHISPAQAQAILLVKVQGHSIEDASGTMGLSPSTIKMNIHRGLARLTAYLEKTPDVE